MSFSHQIFDYIVMSIPGMKNSRKGLTLVCPFYILEEPDPGGGSDSVVAVMLGPRGSGSARGDT